MLGKKIILRYVKDKKKTCFRVNGNIVFFVWTIPLKAVWLTEDPR